ncbi:hypothetical protein [uncultured Mediterranean phage uvMED]|nr:hypothetical protein [uncultured Mediterranean phage uvMED]
MKPRPKKRPKETRESFQSRLRELGFKLGNAERHDWYGQPEKYEAMRQAHKAMLSRQYNL